MKEFSKLHGDLLFGKGSDLVYVLCQHLMSSISQLAIQTDTNLQSHFQIFSCSSRADDWTVSSDLTIPVPTLKFEHNRSDYLLMAASF